MIARRPLLSTGFATVIAALMAMPAPAQETQANKIKAVATFSILGDLVRNVGGDRVDVTTLVGPNGDAHVYSPTPGDARKLAAANIVFVNGLGLEGWMTRLVAASGTKAPMVVVTKGITPRRMQHEENRGRSAIDPHAWQSIADAKIYVANIRDGLVAIDPAGKATYEANTAAYLTKLDELESAVKQQSTAFPPTAAKSSPPTTPSAISAPPTAWPSSRLRASRPKPSRRRKTSPGSLHKSKSRGFPRCFWRTSAIRA